MIEVCQCRGGDGGGGS